MMTQDPESKPRDPGRRLLAPSFIPDLLAGSLVLAVLAWAALSGWRLYEAVVLPHAVVIPTPAPTPTFNPEGARRQQQVLDHLGAGFSFVRANRRDLAEREFRAALALDPQNAEAQRALWEIGVVPPTPVPARTAAPTGR